MRQRSASPTRSAACRRIVSALRRRPDRRPLGLSLAATTWSGWPARSGTGGRTGGTARGSRPNRGRRGSAGFRARIPGSRRGLRPRASRPAGVRPGRTGGVCRPIAVDPRAARPEPGSLRSPRARARDATRCRSAADPYLSRIGPSSGDAFPRLHGICADGSASPIGGCRAGTDREPGPRRPRMRSPTCWLTPCSNRMVVSCLMHASKCLHQLRSRI